MYDTLRINVAQLPVSEEVRQQWQAAGVDFQTKSLEKILITYTITEDGFLEKSTAGWLTHFDDATAKSRVRLVDAHGLIYFYTYVEDRYYEFKARFREGRLTDLTQVENSTDRSERLCVWESEVPVSNDN